MSIILPKGPVAAPTIIKTLVPIRDRLRALRAVPHNYMAKLLIDLGRWHLYSSETLEHREALEVLGDAGFMQMRKHYAKAYPDGVDAYEVTDTGLDVLEGLTNQKFADEALENREHYRTCCTKDTWRKYAPKDKDDNGALKTVDVRELDGNGAK